MKEDDMNHLRQQDKNLRDALRQEEAELPQMPADLNARLMQRMESEQPNQHRTMWRWMAAAACLLLLIGIGYTLLPKEQQDEPLLAQNTVKPQTEAPKAEPEPQAEPQQETISPQMKTEAQPSSQPVRKQRKAVMKLVELIPTPEAESELTADAGDPANVDEPAEQDPLAAMVVQVEDIRSRGQRLQQEITALMNN